jgi:hypothetical protein
VEPTGTLRTLPITLLAIVLAFLGLAWLGMALGNITWNEYKPGKPMDPDLIPWTILLVALGAIFLVTAFGLLRMRAWGRHLALVVGVLFVATGFYGIYESAPLLPILLIPGLIVGLCVLYLMRPAVGSRFR